MTTILKKKKPAHKMPSPTRIVVIILLLSYILVLYFVRVPLTLLLPILYQSCTPTSFCTWSSVLRQSAYLTMIDCTPNRIKRPVEPHFILLNHLHRGILNSYCAAAGVASDNCTIVAYSNYYVPVLSVYLHRILQRDILIGRRWGRDRKKNHMITQIQAAFDRGQTVVMFIDAHKSHQTMRGLNRAVLEHFPHRWKQLIHLDNTNVLPQVFKYQRYPATQSVHRIIQYRQDILQNNKQL